MVLLVTHICYLQHVYDFMYIYTPQKENNKKQKVFDDDGQKKKTGVKALLLRSRFALPLCPMTKTFLTARVASRCTTLSQTVNVYQQNAYLRQEKPI